MSKRPGFVMRTRAASLLITWCATAIVLFGAPSVTAAPLIHNPHIPGRAGTSSNWSGYAAYGSSGKFTSVTSTWKQPSVTCGALNTYSSYWVGLDGYNTASVEQLGTEADCSGGSPTYYAWYEMYPHPGYYVRSVTVVPGHFYTAKVVYAGSGSYNLSLVDNTTGATFSTKQKLPSAKRASAEVIVEAPWSGGVLPLANFGTVSFTGSTANGQAIGSVSSLDPMTMLDPSGGTATPSGLSDGGQSFSVAYGA
jgi:hypothetical protein